MVPCRCLCIFGYGIVNLQKRCLGSDSVLVLLIFASKGWVFSSLCCLSHLSLGSLCTVEFGFRVKLLLLGASYSCASDFNTAQCLTLDLFTSVSARQCQRGTSKSLNGNLREVLGKSGPLLMRFNLLVQSYLLCDHCCQNRRY